MKLKSFLALHSGVALICGLGLLTAPKRLLTLCGLDLPGDGALVGQLLGGALLGLALLSWLSREVNDPVALRAVLAGLLLFNASAMVTLALSSLSGMLNPVGAGLAAVQLTLSVATGLYLRLPASGPPRS